VQRGHHNLSSEMTHFTFKQSCSIISVSVCNRKACRQRWTSSYPHTWSVICLSTPYWELWWSFVGISLSFSQGNSRSVY